MKELSIFIFVLLMFVPPVQAHADAVIFTDILDSYPEVINNDHEEEHHQNDSDDNKNTEHHHQRAGRRCRQESLPQGGLPSGMCACWSLKELPGSTSTKPAPTSHPCSHGRRTQVVWKGT